MWDVPVTHTTTTSTIYEKRKMHGYVLEGTREGSGTGNKFSTATTMLTTAGTTYTFTVTNAGAIFLKCANIILVIFSEDWLGTNLHEILANAFDGNTVLAPSPV